MSLAKDRVALFVPCYVDQLAPQVAFATLTVLERAGFQVDFPRAQTCCGQPMANMGCADDARPLAQRFAEVFADYAYVVCPSASCTAMVRHHYTGLAGGGSAASRVESKVFELCEFLDQVVGAEAITGHFPHRVGLHRSCHGLRELDLGAPSELVHRSGDIVGSLLRRLDGLELVEAERDECCGFGGTFCMTERGVSSLMGEDRIADLGGAEIITSVDMSCLLHLDGLLRRRRAPQRVMHVAEILAGVEA